MAKFDYLKWCEKNFQFYVKNGMKQFDILLKVDEKLAGAEKVEASNGSNLF